MPLISVIVPLAAGETAWQQLLPQLLQLDIDKEILLLCADARDAVMLKVAITDSHVNVHTGINGRAALMNTGAALANGKYLWFLHADSILPQHCTLVLSRAINHQPSAVYYFDLQFSTDGPRLMAFNAAGVYFRSHFLQMPFGDQGFFLEKALFNKIGPFNEQARYGEDHLLVWQAHHHAVPVLPIGAPLISSARKYTRHGWIPTTLHHLYLTVRQALPQYLILLKQRFLQG